MSKSPLNSAFAGLDTFFLMDVFAAGPERLRQSLEGLTAADLADTPRPDKWSIQQIVSHLVDAEIVGSARFRMAYAQPGSLLPGYDQDVWAREFRYQEADGGLLEELLPFFGALRTHSLRILKAATVRDFQKSAKHPERGMMTLRQLLELYADHSERHIEQILSHRKRLGKELALPVLLAKRLY